LKQLFSSPVSSQKSVAAARDTEQKLPHLPQGEAKRGDQCQLAHQGLDAVIATNVVKLRKLILPTPQY
jgi:hypothetical protein